MIIRALNFNPIAASGVTAIALQASISPACRRDFPALLAPREVECAEDAHAAIRGLLQASPPLRPRLVLWDIDETLTVAGSPELLSGRMIGALYAFAQCGIPLGLYTLRPDPDLAAFLRQHPRLTACLARDAEGDPFALGSSFHTALIEALARHARCARLSIREQRSRIVPNSIMRLPWLTFARPEGPVEMTSPKFVPFEGALLVDDKDYSERYRKLEDLLGEGEARDSALFCALRYSASNCWHVGTSMPGEVFSEPQLEGLRTLLTPSVPATR